MNQAGKIIDKLGLQPHPEGGYYRETYRATPQIGKGEDARNVSTSIYYLLVGNDQSHIHRVANDEIWYFHQGAAVEIVSVFDGKIRSDLLGNDISDGQRPQLLVKANTWFGARLSDINGYCLVSCSVSPGFDFADFEMAGRNDFSDDIISQLGSLLK